MILCNICFLDMESIGGEHWGLPVKERGLPVKERITTNDLSLIRNLADPTITRGYYCPNCDARLSYLDALREIIDANAA